MFLKTLSDNINLKNKEDSYGPNLGTYCNILASHTFTVVILLSLYNKCPISKNLQFIATMLLLNK